MKNIRNILILFAAFVASIMMTGCSNSTEISEIVKPKAEQQAKEVGYLSDEVSRALATLPGVSDVVIDINISSPQQEKVYFFNYEQPIDHRNPQAGTFKQRLSLKYVSPDAPVVLYTNGYAMGDSATQIRTVDLVTHLNANMLSVEHRYFNKSLPEAADDLNFTYLWTDQAAADLHAVVDMMKKNFFTQNKWISTGLSKDGITTALYAYYSDKNGWDDIDLFVPFCAPFLPATPTCSDDIRIGQYLYNSCGAGYDADSEMGIAYARLRKMPAAIADNSALREACIKQFYQKFPQEYVEVISTFERADEEVTCGLLHAMLINNVLKFSEMPFYMWAKLVPDVDKAIGAAMTQEEMDAKNEAINQVAEFAFMSAQEVKDSLEAMAQKNLYGDYLYSYQTTRAAYTDNDLIRLRFTDVDLPYNVQAARELGNVAVDFSMLDGTSISSDKAYAIGSVFENHTHMQKYASQWDGGHLMTDFRSWVQTQSKFKMLFVYCSDDPWTGGAIDDSTNPAVTKVVSMGGCHSDSFLDENIYTAEASRQIIAAIKSYIGL
jgi:outer membrane murein-binding lipoprotein Lpp